MAAKDLRAIARRYYRAFEKKDRAFVEDSLADGFTFTSPYDDHIGRDTYFERCWPNSERLKKFTFETVMARGDTVFVLYECETKDGARFRNAEYMTFADGRLKSVEVFFGDPPTGIGKDDYPAFVDVGKQAWDQRLHSF